jgi:putative FmdB family regulatory protein
VPLYDVKCTQCNKEFEAFARIADRTAIRCECEGSTTIQMSPPHDDWFHPFTSEDFTGEPIEVKSKSHYKDLCRRHGVYAKVFGKGHNISEI